VTKNDMVLRIAKEMGMRQTDIKRIVQMTLDGIIDVLVSEQRLELRNFGVFEVRSRKPRKARNPRTGQEVMVPERKVVTFKPGKLMEEKIYGLPPSAGATAAAQPGANSAAASSEDDL
jgi:integration host factor subunit beta